MFYAFYFNLSHISPSRESSQLSEHWRSAATGRRLLHEPASLTLRGENFTNGLEEACSFSQSYNSNRDPPGVELMKL